MREQPSEIRQIQPFAVRASRMMAQPQAREWSRHLALIFLPGVICAFLGPLGSYEAPLTSRLLFWIPTMAAGALIGTALSRASRALLVESIPNWARNALTSTLTSAAMVAVVLLAAQAVFGKFAVTFSWTLVFYVWVISLIMMLIATIVHREAPRETSATDAPTPSATNATPALASRLPQHLRGELILALEAEDHYVRVHTNAGSHLLLLRLSDAANETSSLDGARTHRSWWVNKAAVSSLIRTNGKLSLRLANGLEVPVGRSYVSELKQQGWLAG